MFGRRTKPHSQRPLQPQHDDDDDDRFRPPHESVSPSYENHNLRPSNPVAPEHDDHFLPRSPGQQPSGRGRIETNPHFLRPQHPPLPDDHPHPPPASAMPPVPPQVTVQPHPPPVPPVPPRRHGPISPSVPHIEQVDRRPSRLRGKTFPKERPHKDQSAAKPTKTSLPVPVPPKDQSARKPITKTSPPPGAVPPKDQPAPKPTGKPSRPVLGSPDFIPAHERGDRRARLPQPQRTQAQWWFAAVFCVIFWLIIIIGGLIVLIVYLVFRPQSPHFDVSSVTLNAAYLDLGYLLNADVTVLANFTNPNKKVHVHFSSMIIDLYYGSTLIATQYVEPFSAAKATSRFAAIHMVSSQVQLPLKESQRLMKQMETNGVLFEVKGIFRATSKLGSILHYSYNLYGLCNIMVTRPPDGVMIKRKCRTKR